VLATKVEGSQSVVWLEEPPDFILHVLADDVSVMPINKAMQRWLSLKKKRKHDTYSRMVKPFISFHIFNSHSWDAMLDLTLFRDCKDLDELGED
jgi:hypothetical protein